MTEAAVEKARFTPLSGPEAGRAIPVHFNPASLQYTVTNTLKEEGSGSTSKQYVSQSSAKLTMDLLFDTTPDGADVRAVTERMARLMQPTREPGGTLDVPPVVEFEWGLYVFRGMLESYKETLDFFSASGVPLRSSINLTLARQDEVFTPGRTDRAADTGGSLDAVEIPAGAGDDPASAAARAGDPRGARDVAAASGAVSLRFAAGASLTVGGGVAIGPPAAFAGGGAGIGLGAAAGVSAGLGSGAAAAGAGASAGGAAGLGVSAGAGAGAVGSAGAAVTARAGGAASAGVAASEGAFAGLRPPAPRRPAALRPERLLPRPEAPRLDAGAGAAFSLTGQAVAPAGSGSLGADTGARATLRGRLTFDEER